MDQGELNHKKMIQEIVKQPLEGLLYDLDLLPEQCKAWINNDRRLVIEELYKQKKE